jgi:hypothetical protein
VGPGGEKKKKGNGSTCKIKNLHYSGSKIHQFLTEARTHYEEYNATIKHSKIHQELPTINHPKLQFPNFPRILWLGGNIQKLRKNI